MVLAVLGGTAGALAGLSVWAKKNEFQSPLFLAKYLTTPNSLVGKLFPSRTVQRADAPIEFAEKVRPIEQVVTWKGEHRGISWVLRETETNTLLVYKKGKIVHRWIHSGYSEATPQSSWSVAKSVVGIIASQLIAEGKISYDTKLVEVLPEYSTGGPFDEITILDLMDMRSGIDVSEEYKEWQAYTGVGGLMTTKNLPAYLMRNRNIFATPGTVSDYRSVDTQFLSMVITRIENDALAEIVHKRLWNKIGAVDNAEWNLDKEDGTEKGFMGLNASARDFLKIGVLILNNGFVDKERVIDEKYLKKIFDPAGIIESDAHNWGYSGCWWLPKGAEESQDITALGVYGQYVYVNPAEDTVIVKLSDYGAEQDEDDVIDIFRQISKTA